MRRTLVLILAIGSLAGKTGIAQEVRTFAAPEVDGRRVDLCLSWGAQCGEPAASAWCTEQGYESASEWKPANDIGHTLVQQGRLPCDDPSCDGFAAITCQRSGGAPDRFEGPRIGTVAIDWCLSWGADCGQPAADRFCRDHGYPQATDFAIAEDIGHTVVQASARPCDDPSCDGFAYIECQAGAAPPVTPTALQPWTTQDVIDPRIDVQAQYSLMRMLKGDPQERIDASHILSAVKDEELGGIYQEDQQSPALRAQSLGYGWWQILPTASGVSPSGIQTTIDGICLSEPAAKPPLIVMRRKLAADPARYDATLRNAWAGCGLPAAPVRPYQVTLPAKQPAAKPTACLVPSSKTELVAIVGTQNQNVLPNVGLVVQGASGYGATATTDAAGSARFVLPGPGSYLLMAVAGLKTATLGAQSVYAPSDCITVTSLWVGGIPSQCAVARASAQTTCLTPGIVSANQACNEAYTQSFESCNGDAPCESKATSTYNACMAPPEEELRSCRMAKETLAGCPMAGS